MSPIKQDQSRFRQIVRGKIKQNLKKYMSRQDILTRQKGNTVKIPVPQIEQPRFMLDAQSGQGVGAGEGEVGKPIQPGQGEHDMFEPKTGNTEGEHDLEAEVSLDELAEMMQETLHLPRLEPRGSNEITLEKQRSTGIQTSGPESLRHFKRTYRQALRRQMMLGGYNPDKPNIVPIREDRRYRSFQAKPQPESRAVIVYMMDVSGSMGEEQKEIVRIESFWIDTWLRHQYRGLETRYIIHDAVAKEVDRETFFHTRESGGTMISSAYQLCAKLLETDFPASEYNIYLFHFSDGDNWSAEDTQICLQILNQQLLPVSNLFGYGQVESPYGSGQFIRDLNQAFPQHGVLLTSEINNKENIYRSIMDFFGGKQEDT